MRKIKNGLILAGGDSTRFWPLEEKNFFSFLGNPLILYQIENLAKYCEFITVVASQNNTLATKRILENSDIGVKHQVIIQKEFEGQAGAILSAKNIVKGEILIVNANDIFDYGILEKILQTPQQKNKIVLFGKKIGEYFPGGYFKFNNKGKVEAVIEKPGKDKTPSSIIKLVIDYYSDIDGLIKALEKVKTGEDNHYEAALNKLLFSETERELFIYEGYWQSLKYPWHVLPMLKLFLGNIKGRKIDSSAIISKKAEISGPVFIGENVKVGDFVKISGPVFIGANSVIGDYSLVRESQIGEDCLIGSYSEIARSSIGNKVFLHRNYVGDSVVDDQTMMGAQAVTANLRFNGKTVGETTLSKLGAIVGRESKIGVNATLTPGVSIGKNSWIGPGELVKKDVKDKMYFSKGVEKINLNK